MLLARIHLLNMRTSSVYLYLMPVSNPRPPRGQSQQTSLQFIPVIASGQL